MEHLFLFFQYFLLDPVDDIPTVKPKTTERLHEGQIKVNHPPQGLPNVRPTTPGVRVEHPAINNQRTQVQNYTSRCLLGRDLPVPNRRFIRFRELWLRAVSVRLLR